MKKANKYKLLLSAFLINLGSIVFGAFSGNIGDDGNKFNLKDLGRYSPKYSYGGSFTSSSLSQFSFKGSEEFSLKLNGNSAQFQSMIRLQKGNTTYIYPYKYKVKVPKFKAPTAPNFR